MFDISEKLIVTQSDKIYGVNPINWEDSSCKQLSLIGDEKVISLSRAKVYVFSDFVLRFGTHYQILSGKTSWRGSRVGEPMEFEWNISQDWPHCSSATKSKSSRPKWATHHNSLDELSSCRCSMTSHGDLKTMNRNTMLTPHLWLYLQEDSYQEHGHSSDLDQKRSGILLTTKDNEENGTGSLNWWWSNSEKADAQFSGPRVHCPEERSKAKEVENCRYTIVPTRKRFETVFRTYFCKSAQSLRSSSRNVWRIQSLPCKKWETCIGRTIWPIVCAHKCDENTYTFDRWSCARRSIAKVPRTRGKALTTKSCDKDLYWCGIPGNGWRRTVLHDKGHWRVLTNYRASDMSWAHFTTRWQINWPERLDSREHQNWARVTSHNQLLAR